MGEETAPNEQYRPSDEDREVGLMMKRLAALYREVPEEIATDVESHVMAVYIRLRATIADLRAALDEDQITSLNQITSLPIKMTEETTIENAVPLKYDDRLMANKEKSEYWYWW